MSDKPVNHGKVWTQDDINKIKELAAKGYDTPDIARLLGRTTKAVYSKASREDKTLLPKDLDFTGTDTVLSNNDNS